jgi:hypothetical protein
MMPGADERNTIRKKNVFTLTFGIVGDVLEGELGSSLELHIVSIHKLAAPDLRALPW